MDEFGSLIILLCTMEHHYGLLWKRHIHLIMMDHDTLYTTNYGYCDYFGSLIFILYKTYFIFDYFGSIMSIYIRHILLSVLWKCNLHLIYDISCVEFFGSLIDIS